MKRTNCGRVHRFARWERARGRPANTGRGPRRTAFLGATACILQSLSTHPSAAAETRYDIETDHVEAFDDAGSRSFGTFAKAGVAGAVSSAGVELDFGLGDAVALSLEGDWLPFGPRIGQALTLGLPIFPGRIPFHGFCVHPRLTWERAAVGDGLVDRGGVGATIGWEWTARVGFTARVEGGLVYERSLGEADGPPDGMRPAVDVAVGWVF
jgi:hypothetical protein